MLSIGSATRAGLISAENNCLPLARALLLEYPIEPISSKKSATLCSGFSTVLLTSSSALAYSFLLRKAPIKSAPSASSLVMPRVRTSSTSFPLTIRFIFCTTLNWRSSYIRVTWPFRFTTTLCGKAPTRSCLPTTMVKSPSLSTDFLWTLRIIT